ncbi:hypothetical protein ACFOON_17040 [Novosphingobium piscinae]|uniref:EF-hand domain-containing protein n=1 Tax=Novosphingobium piscinae TaxID=1507448 RepID=A0A7X1G038_9SPHN|nr:hypothetical protein [Novosphingobium piscinae]
MTRTLLGAFATLLLAAAGLFWWQGRAMIDPGTLPPEVSTSLGPADLPSAAPGGLRGPDLPQATAQTREQRRFDRIDRDRDGRISRAEMLVPRAAVFRKLDADGNNLLTFEEWAVVTATRFRGADRNGDLKLDRLEFATTRPKPPVEPSCACRRQPRPDSRGPAGPLDDPDFLSAEEREPVG